MKLKKLKKLKYSNLELQIFKLFRKKKILTHKLKLNQLKSY